MDTEEDADDPEIVEASSSNKGSKRKKTDESDGQASKVSAKAFQDHWLDMPEFRGWLQKVPNDSTLAKCLCCGQNLKAGKSELSKHAKTPKHQANAKTIKNVKPIGQAFAAPIKSAKEMHEENVKKMEIGMSAYFAEHNVAFYGADHLVGVMKRGATDSAIVKDMSLGRLKCAAIVKNVIGKTETEELIEDLKVCFFSVLIDESTDISNNKNMCVLVRYIPPNSATPHTKLLELVRLDARDCSADALWTAFENCLDKHKIPVTRILGLACDNAYVMVGIHNSFWSRLKARCPWAILIACVCHSASLASRAACKALPAYIPQHLHSVSTYLHDSPKRSAILKDFQELYEAETKKILKLADTRWLVMHAVVVRYLQQFDPLEGFFRTRAREEPDDKAAVAIYQAMANPFTKAYMFFLEYVLDFFNQFNALFQSRKVLIHELAESARKLLKRLCQNFILPSELNNLNITNVKHPSNHVSLQNVYLGPQCTEYLRTMKVHLNVEANERKSPEEIAKKKQELVDVFRLKCLDFYTVAAQEMKKRFTFDPMFNQMSFIDPKILLSLEARVSTLPDIHTLASNFKDVLGLDLNSLALEWRTIAMEIEGELKTKLLKMENVEDVWAEIGSLRNFTDEKLFPQLTTLARCVMLLPHSNAEAERAFSVVTDTKTIKRNQLGEDTLNAIVVTRTAFQSKGVNCYTFPIKKSHLDKFNSTMYKKRD